MVNKTFNIIFIGISLYSILFWSYKSFNDITISLTLTISGFTIIIRILKWPYEEWLSVDKFVSLKNTNRNTDIELTGTQTASKKFKTKIDDLNGINEVDFFFKLKVYEKDTKEYIVDISNNMLLSLILAILTGVASVVIGFINREAPHTIDSGKIISLFIPLTYQLTSLFLPFLNNKKRNEKLLIT